MSSSNILMSPCEYLPMNSSAMCLCVPPHVIKTIAKLYIWYTLSSLRRFNAMIDSFARGIIGVVTWLCVFCVLLGVDYTYSTEHKRNQRLTYCSIYIIYFIVLL